MPVTRMRMRPWLEQQIESNLYPGLSWVNKEEMIFQIPWKHAARHGWDINKDACLFRSWAIHTGRHKIGEKESDPKTWKANFRCAMNSLPDIEEVKDKSIYKGSSAVRVYRMLPPQVKVERKERKTKSPRDPKSRLKKKVDGDEEVETVKKNNNLPGDHSSYTTNVFTEAEIPSTDLLGINDCDVTSSISEWRNSLQISPADSTNDLYPFQVSPMSSCSEATEEDEGINMQSELFLMQEQKSEWQPMNIDGNRYYTNESGMSNNCLGELNINESLDEIIKVAGEIEVRFAADLKSGLDLIDWIDAGFPPRSVGLSTMQYAL
ncbi:interferon regulatory factor 1 isoform X2 [Bombina bombina]|uniref:interferon regulatory factor 1 isoform X2 n=1 Tax=Bombina bombina TaxID=8345 RepID=UPI00235AE259|nr:interferon regulatory factor 1 isoform X2 [Bombina bombina]